MPQRIQRKRTKGWKMPENTIYVGRPSKWANPFKVGETAWWEIKSLTSPGYVTVGWEDITQEEAVSCFEEWLRIGKVRWTRVPEPPSLEDIKTQLKGKNLACWCKEGTPCHADILLEIANG